MRPWWRTGCASPDYRPRRPGVTCAVVGETGEGWGQVQLAAASCVHLPHTVSQCRVKQRLPCLRDRGVDAGGRPTLRFIEVKASVAGLVTDRLRVTAARVHSEHSASHSSNR
ncbi:hypothetical protein GCM10010254_24660 [Streptomyces chromofuscus]|nr:hypothetical protein GCM10010254_24660 [Streptomyces chromofuscus]